MKTSLFAVDSNGQTCADCAVRESSVCSSLDEAEMLEFERLSRRVHFSACETVFAQEDVSLPLFSLVDGVIRLYKLLPDGRRQIVGFALPGDLLGMTTVDQHGVSADAVGPVTVCRMARVPFARFSADSLNLLRRVNEIVSRELIRARDHMVLLGRRSAEEKIATFLVDWRRRLAELREPTNIVPLPMSRQDIADYLGLTIETVSRTFTKLERDGVIEIIPGGVCLRNPARVEALSAA
jgi:CRP/FNR family transcriptional regulator, anaerobic regulatory protein